MDLSKFSKTDLDDKERIIKDNLEEIRKLNSNIQILEDKIKFFEMDKENVQERYLNTEKRYKDDIINS
jgi:hypothetical protein